MSELQEIKALPLVPIGPRIIVYPISIPQRQIKDIIIPDGSDIDRMDLDQSRKNEGSARGMLDRAVEHPWQAIVVAIGKQAEAEGEVKVGDIIYGTYTLATSRDVIKVNEDFYVVMGMQSPFCVAGNKKLEMCEIESIVL